MPAAHSGLPGVLGMTATTLTAALEESQGTVVEVYFGWPPEVPCSARHLPSRALEAAVSLAVWLPEGRTTCTTAITTATTTRTRGISRHGVRNAGRDGRVPAGDQPGGRGGASTPGAHVTHRSPSAS